MRVVTFNVQHGRAASGVVDVALLARTCAGFDADVLALQEVDRGVPRSGRVDIAAVVGSACGATVVFGTAVRIAGGDYGNALLVRGRVTDVDVVGLPCQAGHEPRGAVLGHVHLGDQPLSVAATHLSTDRDEAAEQLEVVVAALAGRPLPRLLLGDLNLPADRLQSVSAAGLALAGGGPTFPARSPRVRIDHVAGGGVRISTAEVVATPCSDHRAVVVRLETPRIGQEADGPAPKGGA